MIRFASCIWMAIIFAGLLADNSIALDDVIVGAYGENVGSMGAQGRAYIFEDVKGSILFNLTTPNSQNSAYFGYSVSSGDLNNDSKDDVIVGVHGENTGGNTYQGRAYVFDGATGSILLNLTTPNPQSYATFGYSVSSGDVNNDGKDDIIIGANQENVGGNIDQGRAYVFDGVTGSLLLSLTTPNPQSGAYFGHSVSSGDVNNDGKDDVIVSAAYEDVGANIDQGRAYVFDGATGSILLNLTTPNPQSYATFGYSVNSGDVNNDGKDDIIVGAHQENVGSNTYQGRAYVFDGITGSLLLILTTPNPQSGAYFGCSVSFGEVNSDGKDDVIVGAHQENVGGNTYQGRAYVFDGATGSILLNLTTPNPQSGAFFGHSVSSGDVNSDGKDDVIVGAVYEDVGPNIDQGRAYVFDGATGSILLNLTTPNPQSSASFGFSVVSAIKWPTTDQIGVFRNGGLYFDANGDGYWTTGDTTGWFGATGDLPAAGDWNHDGRDEIAVFRNGGWYFDANGDRVWSTGDTSGWFGATGDLPVAGDWNNDGKDEIAVFRNGGWYFDANGDGYWSAGDTTGWFGATGDLPAAGDWDGNGKDEVAVFRNGGWYFDANGDGYWTTGDTMGWFGATGDLPAAGDWNGDGKDEIALFRNGGWYFDANGDGYWTTGDTTGWFGATGDKPVAGRWGSSLSALAMDDDKSQLDLKEQSAEKIRQKRATLEELREERSDQKRDIKIAQESLKEKSSER